MVIVVNYPIHYRLIHGDPGYWGILLTSEHGIASIQAQSAARHLTMYEHPLTLKTIFKLY